MGTARIAERKVAIQASLEDVVSYVSAVFATGILSGRRSINENAVGSNGFDTDGVERTVEILDQSRGVVPPSVGFGASTGLPPVMPPKDFLFTSTVISTVVSWGTLPVYAEKPPPQHPPKRALTISSPVFASLTMNVGVCPSGFQFVYCSPALP